MPDEIAQNQPLVVAVTGHRPPALSPTGNPSDGYKIPNPVYDLVIKGLADAFTQLKPAYVLTGMALGTDQWAAEICVNMGIPFVAAIPFRGMELKWPPHSQAQFNWLISKAYSTQIICDGEYASWKMQKRNEWMIDSCQQVVAVYNGSSGGTKNCLVYVAKAGKPVYYVPIPPQGMPVGQFYQMLVDQSDGQIQAQPKEKVIEMPGVKRIVEI